jgi:sensor domain CHASE-containing protein
MSVRRKTFIVMAVISALVLIAVYALSRIILEPGSNANEVLRISDHNLRVRTALEREVAELDRRAEDYASILRISSRTSSTRPGPTTRSTS